VGPQPGRLVSHPVGIAQRGPPTNPAAGAEGGGSDSGQRGETGPQECRKRWPSSGLPHIRGEAGKEEAYWGDRTFLPQLWNLLCYREVRMTVWFGDPVPTAASRKVLAARLHGLVGDRIIRTQDLTRMPLNGP
jgi:hypothetical protein